jgi:parallel beta-helix repeat protein
MRSVQGLFFMMVFAASSLRAAPATTSGVLKSDETWEGVIVLTGDVTVPEGITLNIRPNALIEMSANRDDQQGGYDISKCELIVEGILRAEGQEKFEIRFTSSNFTLPGEEQAKTKLQPQAGDWYGLVFRRGGHDKSILSHCIVEFAYDGITCVNASPRIYRNRIEGNYWNGVLCDVASSPKIISNQILNNGYAGVNCKIASAPVVSSNEITGNRYGVLVQDVSHPNLGDTRLGQNTGKNAIYSNLEFNLYNHTKNVIYAQRNDWGDNSNADKTIKDDDENVKYGLVVYTPVYTSGKISFQELQALASAGLKVAEEEKVKKQKEIEALKKQLADKKEKTPASGTLAAGATTREDKAAAAKKQADEQQRLKLLEEQVKEQDRIKVEQEKQLALEKQKDEDLAKEKAATVKKETKAAAVFIPTKMANELDNNPKALQKVNPVMPNRAVEAKIKGTVSLRVLVGVDGKAEEIYVSKKIGNKDFDQIINDEVVSAVKKWVFEPGVAGGQPAKYWTVVTVLMQ